MVVFSSAKLEQHLTQLLKRKATLPRQQPNGAVCLPEFTVAIGTAETADVKHLLVGKEPFHWVHSLLTPNTGFLHWQLKFLREEEKAC